MPIDRRPLVLVIDDEHDFLAIVSHVLDHGGYDVVSAGNGEDGLKMFDDYRPDLVVLDGNLPDLDGLEVCRRLRARETGKTVPVLMCTVRSALPIVGEGLASGVTDYVLKPFEMEELLERVASALKKAGGSR